MGGPSGEGCGQRECPNNFVERQIVFRTIRRVQREWTVVVSAEAIVDEEATRPQDSPRDGEGPGSGLQVGPQADVLPAREGQCRKEAAAGAAGRDATAIGEEKNEWAFQQRRGKNAFRCQEHPVRAECGANDQCEPEIAGLFMIEPTLAGSQPQQGV